MDNTEGIVPIEYVSLCLEERICDAVQDGNMEICPESYLYFNAKMVVPVGSEREFVAKITIPEIRHYTAIGNFVARYYLLILKA